MILLLIKIRKLNNFEWDDQDFRLFKIFKDICLYLSEDVEQVVVYVSFEFRVNGLVEDIILVVVSLQMAFKIIKGVSVDKENRFKDCVLGYCIIKRFGLMKRIQKRLFLQVNFYFFY